MPAVEPAPANALAWYRAPDARARAWAAAQLGSGWSAARTTRLRGGIAAAVDALSLVSPSGEVVRLVLKRWSRPGWIDEDPEFSPAREAAVLSALAGTAVPAPRLVAVDPDGRAAGVPALLVTHIGGRRPSLPDEVRPARIAGMAEALAAIHAVTGPARDVVDAFRPWYELTAIRAPGASARPELWREAIALAAGAPSNPRACFLHRDFHPANTIWAGGRLAGVVDWVSASRGSPAVDLAHWRTNLGTRHGIAVADRVLEAYRAVTGDVPADQPWWDLRLALDFLDAPDAIGREELERLEAYLAALVARL
jgi:aminoglycoside phosphotransferase (APT) family kinase protein